MRSLFPFFFSFFFCSFVVFVFREEERFNMAISTRIGEEHKKTREWVSRLRERKKRERERKKRERERTEEDKKSASAGAREKKKKKKKKS